MPTRVSKPTARPRPATPATGIEPLTTALEREWDELGRRTRATPLQLPGYVLLWRAAFGHEAPLDVVTARRGSELVGALPIVRAGARVLRPGEFDAPTTGIVAVDADAAAAVARALLSTGARRVELPPLPAPSASWDAVRAAAQEGRHRMVCRLHLRCPVVDTADGWGAYWPARSRNLRHKVERLTRRAREEGDLLVEVHERFDDGALQPLLDEGFAIEGSGWKVEEGTAIVARPRWHRYYTDLAGWAAREGWLRLSYVRLDGRPLAFSYGIEAFGVHHALKIGYDPAASRLSPGTLLLEALIRRTFEAGLDRFDFAGHLEPYKAAWATGVEEHRTAVVFPATVTGRAAHRLEATRDALASGPAGPALRRVAGLARGSAARLRRGTPDRSAAGRE